jgi:glycosyltransferase involved in cell wall biosynthesis
MPRVSIVVPNYNCEPYLTERLESLLGQTYRDFELIIVDDGSSDDSRAVIERFGHERRIRILLFNENSGSIYARWNDGAKLCQGEFLLIAGADDSCHPTMIEKLVSRLEVRPSLGLAYSHCFIVDATGRILDSTMNWAGSLDRIRWSADYIDCGRRECEYFLVGNEAIPTASAVMMRRRTFEQVGGLDLTFPLMADYILWVKLLLISDVAFIAEPLTYWRWHPQSVTCRRLQVKTDASDVEEYFRTICYLARSVTTSKERLEMAREKWANVWIDRVIAARGRIPVRQNRRIYQLARELDPWINRRIARLLVSRSIPVFIARRLGLRLTN